MKTGLFLTFILIFQLIILTPSVHAKKPEIMGQAPIAPKMEIPDEKAKSDTEESKAEGSEILAITDKDYSYYLKSGHRSEKWNDLIKPAFETFDNENLATSFIFLKRAYDLGCRDPMVLFRYALFRESQGKFEEAAKLYSEAAEGTKKYYPDHPIATTIHKHAGRTLYQIDNHSKAFPHLVAALEKEPDDFMLLFMTGQILMDTKNYEQAKPILEKTLTVRPPKAADVEALRTILLSLAQITFLQKDYVSCNSYADKVLAIDPVNKTAKQYKAAIQKLESRKREQEMLNKIIN